MKKFLKIFIILYSVFCINFAFGEETKLLTGGISMVPTNFYGTWRVVSDKQNSNSGIFKERSVDLWNLSRTGNVIILNNIFNGAKAQITVQEANIRHVIFTKNGKQKNKELTDTVEIDIDGDYFTGTDKIELRTYVDGKIVKTETAGYKIKGEKISDGGIIE